ncbi:MAG: hypothetical protein EZS28_038950, partial [Streblomastix strix]
ETDTVLAFKRGIAAKSPIAERIKYLESLPPTEDPECTFQPKVNNSPTYLHSLVKSPPPQQTKANKTKLQENDAEDDDFDDPLNIAAKEAELNSSGNEKKSKDSHHKHKNDDQDGIKNKIKNRFSTSKAEKQALEAEQQRIKQKEFEEEQERKRQQKLKEEEEKRKKEEYAREAAEIAAAYFSGDSKGIPTKLAKPKKSTDSDLFSDDIDEEDQQQQQKIKINKKEELKKDASITESRKELNTKINEEIIQNQKEKISKKKKKQEQQIDSNDQINQIHESQPQQQSNQQQQQQQFQQQQQQQQQQSNSNLFNSI